MIPSKNRKFRGCNAAIFRITRGSVTYIYQERVEQKKEKSVYQIAHVEKIISWGHRLFPMVGVGKFFIVGRGGGVQVKSKFGEERFF